MLGTVCFCTYAMLWYILTKLIYVACSVFRDSSLVIYGGQEWCKQLPNLIARLRDRILKKHLSVAKD